MDETTDARSVFLSFTSPDREDARRVVEGLKGADVERPYHHRSIVDDVLLSLEIQIDDLRDESPQI